MDNEYPRPYAPSLKVTMGNEFALFFDNKDDYTPEALD